jgi:Acyl-CoA dehydrogenase, C-terminal domain
VDDETRKLLSASLRDLLTDTDRDTTQGLAELGWDEVLADDEAAATTLLFTEQGQVLAASPALEDVTRATLRGAGVDIPDDAGVLFPLAGPDAAAAGNPAGGIAVRHPGGRPLLADVGPADGGTLLLVTATAATSVTPVNGVDEALRWWAVRGPLDTVAVLADGDAAAEARQAYRAGAARAAAAELCGLAAAMLDLAVGHVRDRRQFGRPLGSFQAVRQDLADALVHLTVAREAVDTSWEERDAWTARCAWSLAVHAHSTTARHAMQVCGGMGLSWEHPLHRYVRRGMALEALLGSGRRTAAALGEELLAGRPVPRTPTL